MIVQAEDATVDHPAMAVRSSARLPVGKSPQFGEYDSLRGKHSSGIVWELLYIATVKGGFQPGSA